MQKDPRATKRTSDSACRKSRRRTMPQIAQRIVVSALELLRNAKLSVLRGPARREGVTDRGWPWHS
ncbi:hypothetical protein X777_11927 [Ooceraea biroi]|uniref:Uncharacterized protein n=1 Tax=Ooceraea biroi TaxID=2015173 RepID=A0A026W316_OOCBI|nr:hypothetical protein X777_11927 [Ooceraea biroi]